MAHKREDHQHRPSEPCCAPKALSQKDEAGSSGLSKSTLVAVLATLILTPITVFAAASFGSRFFYIASVLIIVYALVPFFVSFEGSRPDARELVLLAILTVIAIVSRVAFIWIPFIKPLGAFVVIAGIALGPRSGFIVGALSMFASNLIFGQGPWTPWQMFAFGLLGLAAGLFTNAGIIPRATLTRPRLIAVSAGIALFYVCICGPILDTSSLFLFAAEHTLEAAIAIYGAGLLPNALQGFGAAVTFLLIGNAALFRISRICVKYGIRQ